MANSPTAQYRDTVLHSKCSPCRNSSEALLFNPFVLTIEMFYELKITDNQLLKWFGLQFLYKLYLDIILIAKEK